MRVDQFIQYVGGRKVVMEETGLSKQRMSQWVLENKIPSHWLKFFRLRFPREFKKAGMRVE